jgi:hypothetical protein
MLLATGDSLYSGQWGGEAARKGQPWGPMQAVAEAWRGVPGVVVQRFASCSSRSNVLGRRGAFSVQKRL